MRNHKQKWDGKKVDYEHRIVWEKSNGKIPKGYVIHHKNCIQDDNRIENLELMSNADHLSLHHKGIKNLKQIKAMKKLVKEGKLKTIFKKGQIPWNKGKNYSLQKEHKENVIKAIKKRCEEKRLPHGDGCYTCSKCLKLKNKEEFYKRKLSWNGLQPKCKLCMKMLN